MATKMSKTLSGSGHMCSRIHPTEPPPPHSTHSPSPTPATLPPPATSKPPTTKSRPSLLRCCCSLTLALLFLLGLAAFTTWLALRPIHTPHLSLETAEIRSFNLSGTALTADLLFLIRAENSNHKIAVNYDAIHLEASHSGLVFGRSSAAGFTQGHQNVTTVVSRMVAERFVFTGDALAADFERGRVAIRVRGSSPVRLKLAAITSFAVRVRMECEVVVRPPRSVVGKTCRRV